MSKKKTFYVKTFYITPAPEQEDNDTFEIFTNAGGNIDVQQFVGTLGQCYTVAAALVAVGYTAVTKEQPPRSMIGVPLGVLQRKLHDADSVKTDSHTTPDNTQRHGSYIKLQRGMVFQTFFLGIDLNNKNIIAENVG